MAAIESLRTALGALSRNPVLFLGGLLYGLVVLLRTALSFLGMGNVSTLLQILTFFVTPFVVAGLIGMAAEALDRDTSLRTLVGVGKDRYVPLLVGDLVELAIVIAFGLVVAVVGIVMALVVAGSGGGGGVPTTGFALAAAVALVFVLAFLLVNFLIQFYPVAIAADDAGAVEGFRRSYRLVRNNLLSTLGYSLISFAVTVVTSLPVTGFLAYRQLQSLPQGDQGTGAGVDGPTAPGTGMDIGGVPVDGGATQMLSVPEAAALSVVALALTTLLFAFQRTYAVAFYRRHRRREELLDPDADVSGEPALD